MKTIEEYAKLGEVHDEMEALTLLTKAYISMCGISLGYRTVVYCAAEPWLERLAWLDLPLSEMARKEALVTLMPHITSEYNPERYDKYDITGMDEEELLDGCKQIIRCKEFDEKTLEVLCWGILKATAEEKELSQEIEAIAPDGSPLKGILTCQSCSSTAVTMVSPYNDLMGSANELIRDAEELLVKTYEDYQRLHEKEKEIRALYPKYQDELRKNKDESHWKKYRVFEKVYGELVGQIVLGSTQSLFKEWFGLEFFDLWPPTNPSWL